MDSALEGAVRSGRGLGGARVAQGKCAGDAADGGDESVDVARGGGEGSDEADHSGFQAVVVELVAPAEQGADDVLWELTEQDVRFDQPVFLRDCRRARSQSR